MGGDSGTEIQGGGAVGDKTLPCWSASACADTKALIAGYVMLLAAAMPPASHINLQRPAVVKVITGTQRAGQGQQRHTTGQSRSSPAHNGPARSTPAHNGPVKVNTDPQRTSHGHHQPTAARSRSTAARQSRHHTAHSRMRITVAFNNNLQSDQLSQDSSPCHPLPSVLSRCAC